MMKRVFLMAFLAAVCGATCAQEDTNLYWKVFTCRGGLDERLITPEFYSQPHTDFKDYYSRLCHVTWPEGSAVTFSLDEPNKVIVRNTRVNLNILSEAMSRYFAGCQVAIEFQVFAFSMKDVEKLLNGEGVSVESLMDLRKRGRARLVTTALSITQSGQETVVKDVQEILYPTEIDCEVETNQVGRSFTLAPANFEMREIGTILQVVPEFYAGGPDTLISMILSPQWISLNRWETYEACAGTKGDAKKIPFRQPIVSVSSVQTQLKVESGETVLLGGGKAMDGDWVQYHFLKAWLVWPKLPK